MSGSGKVADVLERVVQIMKLALKKMDYDLLSSGPNNPRRRNNMVHDGLLKADSPHGFWEISEMGHDWLKKRQ